MLDEEASNTSNSRKAAGTGRLLSPVEAVGPTVIDEVQRIIARYGAEAVKDAVKTLTKGKQGRPNEQDWPELRDVIKADARKWLAGGDPFSDRSNYAIAKDFAERNPGHSSISTHKRIERKLSRGPYDRRWFTFVEAEGVSRDNYPYSIHLSALKELASLPDANTSQIWQTILDRALLVVQDFQEIEGRVPGPSMTFKQIEDAVRQSSMAARLAAAKRGGLFVSKSSGYQAGSSDLQAVLLNAAKAIETRD